MIYTEHLYGHYDDMYIFIFAISANSAIRIK